MRIIETDNFGGDYPNETFVNLPPMTHEHAEAVANAINAGFGENCARHWQIVENNYELLRQPFEP